jgi:hypothetical protein
MNQEPITCASALLVLLATACGDNNSNKPASDPSMSRTTSATPSSDTTTSPGSTYGSSPTQRNSTDPINTAPSDDAMQQRPGTTMQSNGSGSTTTTPSQTPSPPSDRNATAADQGNGAIDTKITADIRKAVMADGGLSVRAKNVTIITNGGRVVLRGTVNNASERKSIETKARAITGVSDVSNELEIKQ